MVVRCSNGVGFVVLEPEPAFRTGISVEIYDAANPLNLIDVVPDSFGRKWTDPRKGTGAGEFMVYATNPKVLNNPNLLNAGNIVRFYLDRVPRFAFKIEKRKLTQIGEGDDSAIAWHISGRGVLSLLEDGQVYPEGGLAGSPERPFTDETPGEVMGALLAEAQARSSSILTEIAEGYTTTEDYNNIPFDTNLTLDERAGTDLLRVAERINELAADVHMTPLLELRLYNERGVDRSVQTVDTGPVVLQKGANILELERNEEAVIRNALLIETQGGFVERIEGSSISAYRRREAYLSLGNITNNDQIDKAAEAVFERSANPAQSITIKVLDAEGRRPYVDFGVGDWVLAPDIDGVLDRFRVNALTISEADDGTIDAIPELASLTDDLEERLAKWLKSMARGTMGGTASEVAEPTKAPVEVIEAIDAGLGDHLASQPHFDELADLADTDLTGLEDLDLLQYDAGAADWVPLDYKIDLTGLSDGEVLAYDEVTGKWFPTTISSGGGSGLGSGSGASLIGSDTAAGSGTLSVDIPAGALEGHLAVIGLATTNSVPDVNGPDGDNSWEVIYRRDTSSNEWSAMYYKVLDAADEAAAGSGTWDMGQSSSQMSVSLAVFDVVDGLWHSTYDEGELQTPWFIGHPDGLAVYHFSDLNGIEFVIPGGDADGLIQEAAHIRAGGNNTQSLLAYRDTFSEANGYPQRVIGDDGNFSLAAVACFYAT